MNNKVKLGKAGEKIVAKKLANTGFTILHKNYTQRYGEIDIIASKDDLLVFVEVKMRKNPIFDLEYLITRQKQKKIIKVASQYIARYNHTEKTCRFDVALIKGTETNYALTYIPNAFCE
ncbi:YraN family protein [Candidatus Dependentiae bacterium]